MVYLFQKIKNKFCKCALLLIIFFSYKYFVETSNISTKTFVASLLQCKKIEFKRGFFIFFPRNEIFKPDKF